MNLRILMRGAIQVCALLGVALLILAPAAKAQLNWEGQTGAFSTPFAYVAGSESGNIGRPQIAFHYLNGGDVIGNDYQVSFTMGLLKVTELGYTRSFSSSGSTVFARMFQGGYNTFHGKLNVIPENFHGAKWVPAISIGFAQRFDEQRGIRGLIYSFSSSGPAAVSIGPSFSITSNNTDFYVVGTKTITQITKKMPIILSAGYKRTNAQIMGIGGNAPDFANTAFGAIAFQFTGPAKSALVFGAEAAQQPHHLEGLTSPTIGGPTVPTTLVYFVRVVPAKKPFNVDFGIAQIAGKVAPGIDLKARNQAAVGLSYRF